MAGIFGMAKGPGSAFRDGILGSARPAAVVHRGALPMQVGRGHAFRSGSLGGCSSCSGMGEYLATSGLGDDPPVIGLGITMNMVVGAGAMFAALYLFNEKLKIIPG